MAETTVTLEELLVSSLGQTDALAKLLIEKGVIRRQESISMAISFRAAIAKPLIDSMTPPKFLTNLVWKQNGNILMKIRLPRRKRHCKYLKKLEPPGGFEPPTY